MLTFFSNLAPISISEIVLSKLNSEDSDEMLYSLIGYTILVNVLAYSLTSPWSINPLIG